MRSCSKRTGGNEASTRMMSNCGATLLLREGELLHSRHETVGGELSGEGTRGAAAQ